MASSNHYGHNEIEINGTIIYHELYCNWNQNRYHTYLVTYYRTLSLSNWLLCDLLSSVSKQIFIRHARNISTVILKQPAVLTSIVLVRYPKRMSPTWIALYCSQCEEQFYRIRSNIILFITWGIFITIFNWNKIYQIITSALLIHSFVDGKC